MFVPMSIKIVELDFPWPSFTTDYVGWRSDFTVAGTANEFHIDFPPCTQHNIILHYENNFFKYFYLNFLNLIKAFAS